MVLDRQHAVPPGHRRVSCCEWQVYQVDYDEDGEDIDGDFVSVTCPGDITFGLGY